VFLPLSACHARRNQFDQDDFCAPVVARFCKSRTDPNFALSYGDEEIHDVSTIATLCIVVLAAKFLDRRNYGEECKQVEALAELGLSASHG
jgi:hypothetical protein